GGADGRLVVEIARACPQLTEITVSDISPHNVALAEKRVKSEGLAGRIAAVQQDAHALTFPDQACDPIVSSFSLHHWSDPVKALRELDRVLRPGGLLAILDGHD